MNTRRMFAFSFAAALLSLPFAVTAEAANRRRHTASRAHGRTASGRGYRGGDSENAAVDQLNAQSLARARGMDQGAAPVGTQSAPPGQ